MRNMTESQMYCTMCGKRNIPVQRKINKEREPGHLKKMFCVHCGKTTNMVEIRPFGKKYNLEWFELEYKMGNFKDGERVIPLSDFKKKIHNLRQRGDNE